MRPVDLVITILFLGTTLAWTLSIERDHDVPCIVGDAWAEECKSCVCIEPGITSCRRTFCASELVRALDTCMEDEVTKVGCNTCVCRNNKRVCTKKHCPHTTE